MRGSVVIIFVGIFAVGIATAQIQSSGQCNRACLEGIADQYLAAMVAHDVSKAPLAKDLIFTENTVKLPPTEGLWFTSSGLTDYRFYISDLQEGQIAWVGIVKEHDKPVLLSLRLKVVNRKITEAESIVVRDVSEKNLANLKTPPPAFSETLAPSERISRAEMLKIPNLYFDALAKLNDKDVPFDRACYRLENGMLTAGSYPGAPPPDPAMPRSQYCANGDIHPSLKTIYSVKPRRSAVIDEERGIVWGVYCFNHRGFDKIVMPDGKVYPSFFTSPNTMPAAEIFKIKNGKIRDIFAYGTFLPYGTGDGWSGTLFK
ncbi:MAG TPA: hypothetical protein VMG30_11330 [Acidobacteriota bacterium]|nr:hypothetical protein [Acidobacteriota bacterium]